MEYEHPLDDPKYYYDLGLAFIRRGKYENAIKAFTTDITEYNTYGALNNRAYCYAQIGDKHKAIVDYEKAHERIMEKINAYKEINDPQRKPYLKDLVRVQSYLGELSLQLQSFENARTYYQRALLNCESYPEVLPEEITMTLLYSNSAYANMQLQELDLAVFDFAGALKHSNSVYEMQQIEMSIHSAGLTDAVNRHFMFMKYLTTATEKYENKDYQNAITYFKKAIGANPNDVLTFNCYLFIAESKYRLQEYGSSIEAYNNAINYYYINKDMFSQQHPEIIKSYREQLAIAFTFRGNAKKELQKYDAAIEDYCKSIELDGGLLGTYFSRGVAYLESEKFEEAKSDFKKVIGLNPQDAMAYKNLGNAIFRLGDYQGAIHAYNKAIELSIPIQHIAEIYNNRASAKAQIGDYLGSIKDLNKSLEINPINPVALENRKILINNLKKRIK